MIRILIVFIVILRAFCFIIVIASSLMFLASEDDPRFLGSNCQHENMMGQCGALLFRSF